MSRFRPLVAATAFSAATIACLIGASSASGATAPSAADKTFMAANAQTNLTEITIGQLAMSKASAADVKALAQKTMTDHQTAQTKLMKLAGTLNVTLPSAPNATQKAQAAQLKALSGTSFDQLYLRDQVAGHKLSISGTQAEISGGDSTAVLAYARGYLPVAQMHLQMAQADLSSAATGPAIVQAGSGGAAATTGGNAGPIGWFAAAALLLVSGATVLTIDRRRRLVTQ